MPDYQIVKAQDAGLDLSDHHPVEWFTPDLKWVSYNVQFLPGPISSTPGKKNAKEIKDKAAKMASWLIEKNYDVVCLQELFDNTAAAEIEKRLQEKRYHASKAVGGNVVTGNASSGGVRIFSKRKPVFENECVFHHKVDYIQRGDAFVDKGVKHLTIESADKRIHVLNTHLQAFYDDDPTHRLYIEVALAQLLELRSYLIKQKKHGQIQEGEQIIVCGDFNIPKDASLGIDRADSIAKRGDDFFERAQCLLGSGFELAHRRDTGLAYSFCCSDNTYLKENKEKIDANFDLVFEVDSQKLEIQSSSSYVVEYMQRCFARFIMRQISGLNNQLSSQEVKRLTAASIAMDEWVKHLDKSLSLQDFLTKILQPVSLFFDAFSPKQALRTEVLLTDAYLEKCQVLPGRTLAQVFFGHYYYMTAPHRIEDAKCALKALREQAALSRPCSEEAIMALFSRVTIIKSHLDAWMQKLDETMQDLGSPGDTARSHMQSIRDNLQKKIDHYLYSFQENNEENRLKEFQKECKSIFDKAKNDPFLQKKDHFGVKFKQLLAQLLEILGQALGSSSLKKQGERYRKTARHFSFFDEMEEQVDRFSVPRHLRK